MTSLQQSKGIKPKVIAAVTEDTLERKWQYYGYRIDIKAIELQQNSCLNSTCKIKTITSKI